MIAGTIAGGVGGRIVMRISGATAPASVQGAATEGGNTIGVLSLEGTIALVIFAGVGSGMAGAATVVAAEPWLRGPRWVRGLAVGGLAFAIAGVLAIEADNIDFVILQHPPLDLVMLASLFPLYGYLALWFGDRLEQRWISRRAHPAAVGVVVLGGVASVGMTLSLYFLDETVADPLPRLVLVGLALMGAATLARWVRGLRERAVPHALGAVVAVGAVLVLASGGAYMSDQITRIV